MPAAAQCAKDSRCWHARGSCTAVGTAGPQFIDATAQDVEEVYAVRAALDRLAATSAQSNASADQLAGLDALVDAMSAEIEGEAFGPRLLALDIAFHDRIYEAAANRRLDEAWRAVRSQTCLFQLRRIASATSTTAPGWWRAPRTRYAPALRRSQDAGRTSRRTRRLRPPQPAHRPDRRSRHYVSMTGMPAT